MKVAFDEPTPRYTAHQVARGARPDATSYGADHLLKAASVLHATHQIRLLAYRAATRGRKLIIAVPKHCKQGPSLRRLIKAHPGLIRVKRVDE